MLLPKVRMTFKSRQALKKGGHLCSECGESIYKKGARILTERGWLCIPCRYKLSGVKVGAYYIDKYGSILQVLAPDLVLFPWGEHHVFPLHARESAQANRKEFRHQQIEMYRLIAKYQPWIKGQSKHYASMHEVLSYEEVYDAVLTGAMQGACRGKGERTFGYMQQCAKSMVGNAVFHRIKVKAAEKQYRYEPSTTLAVDELCIMQEDAIQYSEEVKRLVLTLKLIVDPVTWSMAEQHYLYGRRYTQIGKDLGVSGRVVKRKLQKICEVVRGNFSLPLQHEPGKALGEPLYIHGVDLAFSSTTISGED